MHITLEADYAVRIVGCLAQEKKRMDAKALADITCVTLRFSLKILRKLVAAGIVRSYKGVQGGYELAREASDISLMDVIAAVEGRYALSKCLSGEYECSRGMSGRCCFQRVFGEVSQMVEEKLSGYTFDKFIDT